MFLTSLTLAIVFFIIGRRWGVFGMTIDSISAWLWLVASLHFVCMAESVNEFSHVSYFTYTMTFALVLAGIVCGAVLGKKIAPAGLARLPREPRRTIDRKIAIVVIVTACVLSIRGYHDATGTFNPLAGIQSMFSGENTANAMWTGEGADAYGSDRGAAAEEGGLIGHLSQWLSLAPFICLAMLGSREIFWYAIPFFGLHILEMTGGYSARTVLAVWGGMFLLLINDYARRFRAWELSAMATLALIGFLSLHLARLGTVASGDKNVAAALAENLQSAMVDTFEPVGWCFIASERGEFSLSEKVDHFASYFGAVIPRFLWPSKPYYAFEPDLTMNLTGAEIGGNNPVRTFTIAGEGLLVGGFSGVFLIALGYTLVTVVVAGVLGQYFELTLVRYWTIFASIVAFRCSLFTLFSAALMVSVVPAYCIVLARRKFYREALFPWRRVRSGGDSRFSGGGGEGQAESPRGDGHIVVG